MHCTRILKFDVIFSLATTLCTQRKGMKTISRAALSAPLPERKVRSRFDEFIASGFIVFLPHAGKTLPGQLRQALAQGLRQNHAQRRIP